MASEFSNKSPNKADVDGKSYGKNLFLKKIFD